MQNIFYVYEHVCQSTGSTFYVGKGKKNRAASLHRSTYWHNYVNKYGQYEIKFLIKNVDEEFAFLIEQEVIDLYKRQNIKLVNITSGGEGFQGMAAWNKGLKLSESHKKALSIAHTGLKWSNLQHAAYDKPEIKLKHQQAVKKAMAKPEIKLKQSIAISLAKKGKSASDEHKKATSIAIAKWWEKRKEAQHA